MPPSKSPNFTAPMQVELEAANDIQNALLPIQQVPVEGSSKSCNVFFDSGSNTNLVRHAYAQQLGLPGSPVTQHLQVTGKQPEQWDTFAYRVLLCKNNGEIEHALTFGIADITADLPPVNLAPVVTLFSGVQLKDIQRPTGAVDLLLGIHEANLSIFFWIWTSPHRTPSLPKPWGGYSDTPCVREGPGPVRQASQPHLHQAQQLLPYCLQPNLCRSGRGRGAG